MAIAKVLLNTTNAHYKLLIINTLPVVIMQVPSCGGLLGATQTAIAKATRKTAPKLAIISEKG